MRPWIVAATCALSSLPRGLQAATTCPESGIAPPSEITLAAAASGADDVAVLVKDADCDEVTIDATSSENPGEYRINASYVNIAVVESYPAVASLWLWNNKIQTFKAVGTSVTEVDITSNQLTSLDGLEFPSSVQMLTLDLNAITSTSASDFPENLQKLYLRKNSIDSLAKFRFSSSLQNLYLNGNQQLTTLEGAVFPDSLQDLECSDCRITEIVGVAFPSSLKTMTLGGTTVTNFIVRESDVEVLQSAQLSMTVSLDSDGCSGVSGTVTDISDSILACVLSDVSFSSLYPTSSSEDSAADETSSSKSSTTSTTGSGTSSSATSTDSTSQGTGSGTTTVITINQEGSSSNAGLYGGIAAAVVVVVLAVVGFIIYRRRKQRQQQRQSPADGFLALDADKDSYNGVTGATGSASQTLSLPPSSTDSGYLSNDVRNDEDLIPFRLPIADIIIERELASGGFGVVYLAGLYSQLVVVKQILPKAMSKDLLRRFMDEIRLEMDTCGHPYNSNLPDADALTDAKIAILVSSDAIKPTIEDDCPPEIREVILRCVAFDPASRPSAVALHYQLRNIASAYRDMPMI
ncbi:uncharacterized protein KRP23_10176 [Phytophthora ramorum]|uniref:uncharacterized protein n=1 Tax=Phytophthora ramorum TaxID=164328 RepID=UPI0030A9DB70|nr:hypothetical protein KRP23_10176 [Phytophthora ramorum]